jgi:hypothetical protein
LETVCRETATDADPCCARSCAASPLEKKEKEREREKERKRKREREEKSIVNAGITFAPVLNGSCFALKRAFLSQSFFLFLSFFFSHFRAKA